MSTDSTSTSENNTFLNDQIADSVSALKNLLGEDAKGNISLIAYQIMVQAAGLAMLNAVNQQQQMYILQNAATTAAAKAVLNSKPEDADKVFNDAMKSFASLNSNLIETFNGLKGFMDDLIHTYNDLKEKTAEKK